MSARNNTWGRPGWAWELEILTFALFVLALAVPYYLYYTAPPRATEELSLVQMAMLQNKNPVDVSMEEQRGIFWALIIAGLYVGHLVISNLSLQFISTPFLTIFTPSVFASLTYYRTSVTMAALDMDSLLYNGSIPHLAAAFGLALCGALLLARIRMRRLLHRFRDTVWGVDVRNQVDGSMIAEVLAAFRPLIYPPQRYKACEEGILIVGYFYVMPIPFRVVQSVVRSKKGNFLTSSYTLATSGRSLVRIQLTEQPEPIFISPRDTDEFVRYCEPYTHAAASRTSPGDTRTSRQTAPGVSAKP